MGSRAPLYEPLPSPELLNNKINAQAAEIERLLMENKKLAATNSAMRKEVGADLQEIQRIKSYIGSIHTESDIHVRALIEKLRKIDDDIRATEMLKEELAKAQEEAKALASTKQELAREHQNLTEESIKAAVDAKMLPELLVELEKLKQEHQNLRVAFEHEKGSNLKQVEHMRGLEKNWMSLAREVEKLRADITNAKRVEHTASPYPSVNYGNPTPLYPQARRAVGFDPTVVANSNAGTDQGNSVPYNTQPYAYSTNQGVDGYLRPHV